MTRLDQLVASKATPLQVGIVTNLLNALLDPLLMHPGGPGLMLLLIPVFHIVLDLAFETHVITCFLPSNQICIPLIETEADPIQHENSTADPIAEGGSFPQAIPFLASLIHHFMV